MTTSAPAEAVAPPILKNAAFRRLWIGSTISLAGDQFYLVALPWVVLQLTGSAVAMGTILMTAAVPRAALMLMGGAVADRLSPRRVLISTASWRTVVVGLVGLLLWRHWLQVWELYVLGFAFGVADAFSMPAISAFLPSVVGRDRLLAANAVMQTTMRLTMIAGPAPAGLVIKAAGAAWAFIVDAVSFLFIIAALWTLPDPPADTSRTKPSTWKSVVDGLRYIRQDKAVSTLIALATVMNVCITGPMTVGVAYLARTKFESPAAFGFAVSSLAAGGLLGSALAGWITIRRRGLLLVGAAGAISVCLAALAVLDHLAAIACTLAAMSMSASVTNVNLTSWIQGRVEPAMRGRVVSVLILAAVGLQPISMAASGVLAAWSLSGMFVAAGAALLVTTIVAGTRASVRAIA